MSTTKVITGKVRFSYVNIFKSRAFQAGQDAKYSVCLLIPKEDKATIKKIKAAIDAAVQDGISSKWGGKKPANLKQPLRDGDAERADEAPEYEGMYFLNCNSTQKPGIVDKDLNEILDPDEVYSGCWGRASINFFPFNTNGNKGVGVGLNNMSEEEINQAIKDFKANREKQRPNVDAITRERDDALAELAQMKNSQTLAQKGVRAEDTDYVMFKIAALMKEDSKLDFEKAATKFLKENPRFATSGSGSYRVKTGTESSGAGSSGNQNSNDFINAAIRRKAGRN